MQIDVGKVRKAQGRAAGPGKPRHKRHTNEERSRSGTKHGAVREVEAMPINRKAICGEDVAWWMKNKVMLFDQAVN